MEKFNEVVKLLQFMRAVLVSHIATAGKALRQLGIGWMRPTNRALNAKKTHPTKPLIVLGLIMQQSLKGV
jgi:hypothetical protein